MTRWPLGRLRALPLGEQCPAAGWGHAQRRNRTTGTKLAFTVLKSGVVETAEYYWNRLLSHAGADGQLEQRPYDPPSGWDACPYEPDQLRLRPLMRPRGTEPERVGDDPTDCRCQRDPTVGSNTIWWSENWRLELASTGLPFFAYLAPRAHLDLSDISRTLAAELGILTVLITKGVETLPSVGRCYSCRWGDGAAHGHLYFLGRPYGSEQIRGHAIWEWLRHLPEVPRPALVDNAAKVVSQLVHEVGGEVPLTP